MSTIVPVAAGFRMVLSFLKVMGLTGDALLPRSEVTAYLSSIIPSLLAIVLLCSGLGCSRHTSSEPVT
jgi:hypothetical protein